MNKLIILIPLIIFSTLLWNIPDTVSLTTNTHSFYNGSAPCVKCHGDIQNQLEDVGTTTTIHHTLDEEYGCKTCHSSNNTHAASQPQCINCHNVRMNNSREAHSMILNTANTSSLMEGINEACVVCHTTMLGSITIGNKQVFAFESDSISLNNTPIYNGTYTITLETEGMHTFNDGVNCIICHAPIYDTLYSNATPIQHQSFECKECHASGDDSHSAQTKFCSDCHEINHHNPNNMLYGCMRCHDRRQPDSFSRRDCNRCHLSHGGLKV